MAKAEGIRLFAISRPLALEVKPSLWCSRRKATRGSGLEGEVKESTAQVRAEAGLEAPRVFAATATAHLKWENNNTVTPGAGKVRPDCRMKSRSMQSEDRIHNKKSTTLTGLD